MSNERNAQELLKWGLANSAPDPSESSSSSNNAVIARPGPSVAEISADIAAGKRPDLSDPHLYDAIMGKSEAQMMKEELAVAILSSQPLESRLTALDNFEMLIEQIDNANNITNMKMWPDILQLLNDESDEIKCAAAWVVGTAVQNNDKAQVATLEFGVVEKVLNLLRSADEGVRAKGMYALSGVVKHNPAGMAEFDKLNGWEVLKEALVDPNLGLRRKTAFLINALLFQDPNEFEATASAPATSSATAVAPVAEPRSNAGPRGPVAPIETGPATAQTNVAHPNVSQALLRSGILVTLLSSMLPPNTPGVSEADLPPPSGPDGDTDPRSDLDFAEKSATALITFVSKLSSSAPQLLDEKTKGLFKALLKELEGKPMDGAEGAKSRWEELGLDEGVFGQFKEKVGAW